MNNTENIYCRFCAGSKQQNELKDLQIDVAACEDIVNKLTRLNCQLDFKESILPKTICSLCNNSLQSAFSFVVAVEAAQVELKEVILLQSVQIDIGSQREERITFESADDILSTSSSSSSDPESIEIKSESTDSGDIVSEENFDINKSFETDEDDSSSESKNHTNCQENNQTEDVLDAISVLQSKLTWSDYPWKCTYCETQFPKFSELRDHSIKYHQVCNAFRCADCNNKFLRFDNFLTHICTHRKYLQLTCFKCRAVFSTLREVKVHRRDHYASNFKCDGCNSCFSTKDKLLSHMQSFYKNARSPYLRGAPQPEDLVCVICQKKTKSKRAYNTHILCHTVRKRDHVCDICGKGFMTKQTLVDHKKFHEDVRPFKCDICKAAFRTMNYLQKHITVHDGIKPFSCKECGKCFRLQKQLNSHGIVHTESHPYACTYCPKQFRFKTLLQIHIRQHTGEKPYSCDSCQKDFTNWSNFNKHMKRIHGKSMTKRKRACGGVKPIDSGTEQDVESHKIKLETDKHEQTEVE